MIPQLEIQPKEQQSNFSRAMASACFMMLIYRNISVNKLAQSINFYVMYKYINGT